MFSRVACSSLGLVALGCAPDVTLATSGASGAGGSATSATSTTSNASSAAATSGAGGAGGAGPLVIAKVSAPWGIAVNATSVVFTSHDNNLVARVPLGGGAVVPLATDQLGPTAVALSDGVAWIGLDGGLARVTLDGQSSSLFLSTFITHAVAVRAGVAYLSSGPNIESTPLAGGAVQLISQGSSFVEGIAVDDARVYWSASGGQIQSAPIGGGPMTTLASFNAVPYGIAVDSTYVYFSTQLFNGPGGAIMRAPLDKSSPAEMLAANESQPRQLVLDGSTLYWVDYIGNVRAMPASGGAPKSLYQGDPGPNAIAVDATSVYWSNDLAGTITKIAK